MRDIEYTESELRLKDDLDRLFWIEIAKRKAMQMEGQAFHELIALCLEMGDFFKKKLSEDEWMEFNELNGDVADIVLDIFQFRRCFVSDSAYSEVIQQVSDRFEEKISGIAQRLTYAHGFSLADFSATTDLELLHHWWTTLGSLKFREELGISKGKFSYISDIREPPDFKETEKLKFGFSSFSCLVRIPRAVLCNSEPVVMHTTDEVEIKIGGEKLKDRLIIEIDLTKPLPSMRDIEANIFLEHGLARDRRLWEIIESGGGIIPEDYFASSSILARLPPPPPPWQQQLFQKQSNVTPLIKGLFSWDLVFNGMSKAGAYNEVADKFGGSVKSVETALKNINFKIAEYQSSMLPWVQSK